MQHSRQFYINGVWVDPAAPHDFPVENPATEEVVDTISLGTAVDINKAVTAARAAFDSYSKTSREQRLMWLENLCEIYQRRYNEMAQAITNEMGAPKSFSEALQARCGLNHIEQGINVLKSFAFEEDFSDAQLVREPIGVCALITPWNWPINQVTLKVIPALATGCTLSTETQ